MLLACTISGETAVRPEFEIEAVKLVREARHNPICSGVSIAPSDFAKVPSYIFIFDARRRYFLKNCGPLYTAVVDACAIVGLSLGGVKDFLTGKQNNIPPHLLIDSISHSVFAKGFRVPTVKNPAKSPPA